MQNPKRLADRLVFGTMTFGKQVSQAEADRIVATCLEFGITRFDTSNNYNDGASERVLGVALTRCGAQDVEVSTKVGSTVDQADPELRGLTPAAIRKALSESLARLGLDHVDTYYLHRPDRSTPIEATLETLAELVDGGRVRRIGQSNFAAWQIMQMWSIAAAQGFPLPTESQQMYNLISRRIEAEYLECAATLGLQTLAYNPLAGGLLTGKHLTATATDGRFAQPLYRERYLKPELLEAVQRLDQVARDAGMSLIALSFRWLLERPGVDGVLLGASSHAQLEQNLASLDDTRLSDDVRDECDDVWAQIAGAAPAYNR